MHAPVQSQLLNIPKQRTRARHTRQTEPRTCPRHYAQQACSNNATPTYRHGPRCPALSANPFSKVADARCRLPLPTLPTHQRRLTLGTCCGCWHGNTHETMHLSVFENHGQTTHLSRHRFCLPPLFRGLHPALLLQACWALPATGAASWNESARAHTAVSWSRQARLRMASAGLA